MEKFDIPDQEKENTTKKETIKNKTNKNLSDTLNCWFFKKITLKTKLLILAIAIVSWGSLAEIKNDYFTKKIINYELNKKQNKLHDVINKDEDVWFFDNIRNKDFLDKQKIKKIDKIFSELKYKIENAESKEEIKEILNEAKSNWNNNAIEKLLKDLILTDSEKEWIKNILTK